MGVSRWLSIDQLEDVRDINRQFPVTLYRGGPVGFAPVGWLI
jgi:hypothetical protein